jgi:hypothetical protein
MDKKIKVQVIGDCQTARLQGQHINAHLGPIENLTRFNPEIQEKNSKFLVDSNIEVNFWGRAGYKCFGLDLGEDINQNLLSSAAEDAIDSNELAATHPEYPNLIGGSDLVDLFFNLSDVTDADLVMPFLGYVDCRNWIPKYNNAEQIVRDYVHAFITEFPSKKIRFIEPFPQFKHVETYAYSMLDYEARSAAEKSFIAVLRQVSEEYGLLPPVTQDIVYDAIGEEFLLSKHARPGGEKQKNTLVDGILPEYNKKVYENLSREIKETVNLLF